MKTNTEYIDTYDSYDIKARRSYFHDKNHDNIDTLTWIISQYDELPSKQKKYFSRNLKKNLGAYTNSIDYADYDKLVDTYNCALENTIEHSNKPKWYDRFIIKTTHF